MDNKRECCKCKHVYKASECGKRQSKKMKELKVKGHTQICPKCGHDEYYAA